MTKEQIIQKLNNWDNYAEMSDDPFKGNKMYDDIAFMKRFLTSSTIKQIVTSLNDSAKLALSRYFNVKLEDKMKLTNKEN